MSNLPNDLFPITIDDQIAEAQRELAQRQGVYERLVVAGKMRRDLASRRISIMAAIITTLQSVRTGGGKV